jgi:hypothetical protein
MKTILMNLMIVTVSHAALADTTSFICTSANGSVQVLQDKVVVKAIGLGGPQTIKLETSELNLASKDLILVEKSKKELEAFCGKSYLVKAKTVVREVTISKKDGSDIFTDDTPQSSLKKIKTKLLCDIQVVGTWPCN